MTDNEAIGVLNKALAWAEASVRGSTDVSHIQAVMADYLQGSCSATGGELEHRLHSLGKLLDDLSRRQGDDHQN